MLKLFTAGCLWVAMLVGVAAKEPVTADLKVPALAVIYAVFANATLRILVSSSQRTASTPSESAAGFGNH